jgi:hypothetical protein
MSFGFIANGKASRLTLGCARELSRRYRRWRCCPWWSYSRPQRRRSFRPRLKRFEFRQDRFRHIEPRRRRQAIVVAGLGLSSLSISIIFAASGDLATT